MSDKKSLKRIEARIGHDQNEWLDKKSYNSGISKSSLVQLAVEQYIKQEESMVTLQDFMRMFESDEFQQQLNSQEK